MVKGLIFEVVSNVCDYVLPQNVDLLHSSNFSRILSIVCHCLPASSPPSVRFFDLLRVYQSFECTARSGSLDALSSAAMARRSCSKATNSACRYRRGLSVQGAEVTENSNFGMWSPDSCCDDAWLAQTFMTRTRQALKADQPEALDFEIRAIHWRTDSRTSHCDRLG